MMKKLTLSLIVMTGLMLMVIGVVSAATITVCASGCNFVNIQDAVNAASSGDTIEVAAGTYDENIVIGKSLTVRGANAGIAATETRGSESIINAQGAEMAVLINGADTIATFDGFTVDNYDTVGILAGAFATKWGDDPIEVHILNNIVMPPTIEPPNNNNIQVGDGTTGTIIGNEVSGANLESPDWSGSGILVAGSSNVVVSENYVHNCEGGIQIVGYEYKDAPAVDNIIENNIVKDSETGISVQGDSIGTIIRYNDVLNNDIGIGSLAFDYPWQQATPSGTEIYLNNIVGNKNYGVKSSVWFWKGTGEVLAEEVNATKNWWGHASGPSGLNGRVNPDGKEVGKGDAVSTNVDWDPWLPQLIGLTPNKPVPLGLR